MQVVIVESPAKAKTINKYLGPDYHVIASFGHIRDLPSKDGSVLPDEDFKMIYEVSPASSKHVKSIAAAVKGASHIYLATDPDREGEAISWHIVEALKSMKVLKKDQQVHRIVFNEITKNAVINAVNNPRDIDINLVNAQQARRALDYLVGFNLSPVLWRKLPGSRSAGRVQSVALRLISERENEIERFIREEYWTIFADLLSNKNDKFSSNLTHIEGRKLEKLDIKCEADANVITDNLRKYKHLIAKSIERKQTSRNPQPPFTTSSIQQEASRKLGFSAKQTMQVAQKLYEGIEVDGETVGLITYMRTDGTQLSNDAVNSARNYIKNKYGADYLPKSSRIYKTKAKNAQEAHEAIRPTNFDFSPDKIKSNLSREQFALYELVWQRTIACQMENAILDSVAVVLATEDDYAKFRTSGSVIKFDGFYKLYREGQDDKEDEVERRLPNIEENEKLAIEKIGQDQHSTEPPPRYGEASLVKKLEELGIGRPSTYASIISVLQDRNYVKLEKKRFIPEERGRLVTAFLVSFFKQYVEYDFTAELENKLDDVSSGSLEWKELLQNFWGDFSKNVDQAKQFSITEVLDALEELLSYHLFPKNENGTDSRICPSCLTGKLSLKLGKFGAFIACSCYPECKYTKQLSDSDNSENGENTFEKVEDSILGNDPKTGLALYLKKGPYGYYVQLGEDAPPKSKTVPKPKRVALPAGVKPNELSFEQALELANLPREIGNNPVSGKLITANIGRFGPYLLHDGKFTSLTATDNLFTVNVERAADLINNKTSTKASGVIKLVATHPETNTEINLCKGRFGPYLKYGKANIKIPNNIDGETMTEDQALSLVKQHEEKSKS